MATGGNCHLKHGVYAQTSDSGYRGGRQASNTISHGGSNLGNDSNLLDHHNGHVKYIAACMIIQA